MADLATLKSAIESGDRSTAVAIVRASIEEGLDPRTILSAMTAAMEVVGDRYQRNEIFIPEMLVAARAMKESMAFLEPVLIGAGIHPEFTAVIGTVRGDLHDLGKNLVAMMWRGANIDVIDLGINVPPQRFAEAAREHDARLVGVSALLTTTMPQMRDVVAAVRAVAPPNTRIIVGGQSITAEYAREIGADAYAPDAAAAVDVARQVLAG